MPVLDSHDIKICDFEALVKKRKQKHTIVLCFGLSALRLIKKRFWLKLFEYLKKK